MRWRRLGDGQIPIAEMGSDVDHDPSESCGCYAAPLGNRPTAACGGNDRRH